MIRRVQELIRYVRLQVLHPLSLEGRSELIDVDDVVFSFTTTPERIFGIKPMVNSLLDQDKKVMIWLNLPKDRFKDRPIPEYLERLISLRINWIEKDLGPATKLLPTLKLVKRESLIIVVDDDQVYPRQLTKSYMTFAKQQPNAAMTLQGWKVPKGFDHRNRKPLYGAHTKIFDFSAKIESPIRVDILQGSSSYAVRPDFFDKHVFYANEVPGSAYYADDIWISGNLARKGTKVFVIPTAAAYSRISGFSIRSNQKLIHTHNQDFSNNNEMYRYFRNYWI